MTKSDLRDAVKKYGSVEKFAKVNIAKFAKKIVNKYNVEDEVAVALAKPMVMELIAEITYQNEKTITRKTP